MKNFYNISFVRWGNLNARKHKEGRFDSNSESRTFHTAPCYKGIYAFPKGLVETFLLSGVAPVSGKIQDRCFYLKDDNGNKIDFNEFEIWDESSKDYVINKKYKKLIKQKGLKTKYISSTYDKNDDKFYVIYYTNCHKDIKYNGLLWHHLTDIPKDKIIKENGSWILTDYKTYCKALQKYYIKDKFFSYMKEETRHGNPHSYPLTTTKDHYEVFIEHLK